MKKIISGLLACAALLSIGSSAAAESTKPYDPNKFAAYSVTAAIMQKQLALDIVIPSKIEAAITKTYNINTNERFDIATSDTGIGAIDNTLMAMDFYSGEYQIVNNSEIPIKVFTSLSAKVVGKVVIIEDPEIDVEADDNKNLKLWISHSMEEGGTVAKRDSNNKRIFDAEKKGDILITKKEPASASVLFEKIPARSDDGSAANVGYFRINGQAKEIPQPYWDTKDGVTIKFVLKVTPAAADDL